MSISFVPRRAVALTVSMASVALLAAACGPSSTPSSAASSSAGPSAGASLSTIAPASPPGAAVCADVAALRVTATDIIHVKLNASTLSTLTAELNTAQTELDNLASTAHGQWKAQVSGLQSALTALQSALSAEAKGTGSIIKVIAAAGNVTQQAHLLLSAASSCPSPSSAG